MTLDSDIFKLVQRLWDSLSPQEKNWIFGCEELLIENDDEGEWVYRYFEDGTNELSGVAYYLPVANEDNLYSVTLFVHPKYRGRFIGRDLIQTFFERHPGARLLAKICKDNDRSIEFFNRYTKARIVPSYTQMMYHYECVENPVQKRIGVLEEEIINLHNKIRDLQLELTQLHHHVEAPSIRR